MKKFFLAMIVAAATMINFSSCKSSSSDDEKEYEIQVTDLLGNTFLCTEDDNGEEFIYSIDFSNDGQNGNMFSTSDGEVGTFTISGSTITLTFTDMLLEPTGETMILKAQSKKKLACPTLKCVLKKD